MKKYFAKKYLLNKYSIIGIIVFIVAIYLIFIRGSKEPKFDYVLTTVGDISEKVSVTGKISPVEKADLAFEKSGRVTSIKVKIGDYVKKGDLLATLDMASDYANLTSAQAKLADLSRGLNDPELALEQSKIKTASISLDNKKQEALNAIQEALALTQSALFNYTDTFFDNPQSVNPTINIRTSSQAIQISIDSERVLTTEKLNAWSNSLKGFTIDNDIQKLLSQVSGYQTTIKNFIDHLLLIVNDLNPINSGLSRSTIDGYVTAMNTGLSTFNQAISSVSTAKTALENAITNYEQIYNNYLLQNSGSSKEAIAAQTASVDLYRAELSKGKLVSPIDGIVTKIVPEVGEYISPGTLVFSVININEFKIEAYVPEADIAKVKIGNYASTTLDAYGQSIDFPTLVTSIDPAETILEGVPTYKITLKFIYKDERVKSGMTANLDILTREKKGVLIVPSRAIINSFGTKSIRIVDQTGKNYETKPVTVGFKGSDGMIEVISGLNIGDKVVTYVK